MHGQPHIKSYFLLTIFSYPHWITMHGQPHIKSYFLLIIFSYTHWITMHGQPHIKCIKTDVKEVTSSCDDVWAVLRALCRQLLNDSPVSFRTLYHFAKKESNSFRSRWNVVKNLEFFEMHVCCWGASVNGDCLTKWRESSSQYTISVYSLVSLLHVST